GAEAHYTEKLVRFKNLPLYYYRPAPAGAENGSAGASPSRGAGTGGALERGRFGLREDATVYGCLHSTFKLHPEFDAALGEIRRRDENGVILVPQGNVPRW